MICGNSACRSFERTASEDSLRKIPPGPLPKGRTAAPPSDLLSLFALGRILYYNIGIRIRGGAADISLSGFQEIDVHSMTRVQAITAIDARLRRADASVYRLRVIHGFHGGTALRDAVRTHYKNHPKVKRIEIGLNQGETDLILREL